MDREIQDPCIGSHIKLMILEDLPSLQEPLRVGNNSFYNSPPNTISGLKKGSFYQVALCDFFLGIFCV